MAQVLCEAGTGSALFESLLYCGNGIRLVSKTSAGESQLRVRVAHTAFGCLIFGFSLTHVPCMFCLSHARDLTWCGG